MGAQTAERLPVGLAAYGLGYLAGFAGAGTARACADPLNAYRLMDLATTHSLSGVEFPPVWGLGNLEPDTLAHARAYADERGLFIVVDGGVVNVEELHALIPAATALGAKTVRVTASAIHCGDRRQVRDTWPAYLREITGRLREVRGLAEDAGVSIAIENHQDLTTEEMVAICQELDSPAIGVNLDAINPLAVVEDPLVGAARVAPYLKNVHLKDYYIYSTPQGYRLVRSAIGAGVLDVQGLFDLLAREAPRATVSIELGALEARHVRFLEDDFWPGYPPRQASEILPVLRLRESRTRPPREDWRTPWERGEQGTALAAYELDEIEQSVEYLRRTVR